MAKLVIQPSGGASARAHFAATIERPVNLRLHADLLPNDLTPLLRLYPSGFAPTWGVAPGLRHVNVRKYDRSAAGDVVFFTGGRRVFAGGVLTYKLQSPDLAARLWGRTAEGTTWEYMYFLDDVRSLDIPYEPINVAAGYVPEFSHLGFNVLDEERATRVFEVLGPADLPLLLSRSFGVRAKSRLVPTTGVVGEPYEQIDEAQTIDHHEPVAIDPHQQERGLRGHARTQNALAAFVASLGATPLRPRPGGPDFDLAWAFGDDLFVAEVKSTTAANQTRQLRLALGQVLDYADQLATSTGKNVRPVIAVETTATDRWTELALRHGVALVSPSNFGALGVLMELGQSATMKCLQNDGGICSIPPSALVVDRGTVRRAFGADREHWLAAASVGRGEPALVRVSDEDAAALARGEVRVFSTETSGVIVTCSCGHTYILPRSAT